ncbi:DUF3231 family protein [Virgibacillus ihumii]|uniref:DUF3231 family protein n=1 Tax=Virgibacillus ihumii TaxID=2686091 RepID=UPI00157D892C|nr:DUF3231 family protein [Virgibacillus ihumii]
MSEEKIHLTSSEIASLWNAYMNDSMSKCILGYMLQHIQDNDIKPVVRDSYDLSCDHLEKLTSIFEDEQYSIPNGFNEQDVNFNAPWLFTDTFCLTYVNHMAKVGMLSYSGTVSLSFRDDICTYFSHALHETNNLYRKSLKIALNKGINARPPYIEVPKETDYVNSKKYMSGINPLSSKRPLNAVEISYLYMNITTNSIGVKLCLAFAQTSSSKEVQEFMLRGKRTSKRHIKLFVDALMKDNIQAPHVPDVAVSDSTTKTFSDKLMMFHMSLLTASGIGNYATAMAASQRSDLALRYERLSLEVSGLAKTGADIMIKNNWLEQPPGIVDREKLARNKRQS